MAALPVADIALILSDSYSVTDADTVTQCSLMICHHAQLSPDVVTHQSVTVVSDAVLSGHYAMHGAPLHRGRQGTQ